MKPEEALDAARRAAAERAYAEAGVQIGLEATEPLSRERLLRWALVEPDPDLVRSTRHGVAGRAMTGAKRFLMRGLRQYHGQLVAQQTRFNLHVLAYLTALEERIERLEDRERDGGA